MHQAHWKGAGSGAGVGKGGGGGLAFTECHWHARLHAKPGARHTNEKLLPSRNLHSTSTSVASRPAPNMEMARRVTGMKIVLQLLDRTQDLERFLYNPQKTWLLRPALRLTSNNKKVCVLTLRSC